MLVRGPNCHPDALLALRTHRLARTQKKKTVKTGLIESLELVTTTHRQLTRIRAPPVFFVFFMFEPEGGGGGLEEHDLSSPCHLTLIFVFVCHCLSLVYLSTYLSVLYSQYATPRLQFLFFPSNTSIAHHTSLFLPWRPASLF